MSTRALLMIAIGLRILTSVFLGPTGSDHHYEVIEAILRDGAFPRADIYAQAFHPPAYYVLSLPWALAGGARAVEVFSLLLSIVNVWLLYGLIERFVESERARRHAMALVALLPQFVVYSILVSNDGLSFLVGTLAILAALRFTSQPGVANAALAGLMAAFGLLTKGTLLAHAAVLFVIVAVVSFRRLQRRTALACIATFLALTVLLGSYKFIENQQRFGRPIVHNMDFDPDWAKAQRPTITGAASWIDVNVVKLLREPYAEHRDGTWTNPHSVPLLFYATLWHHYVPVSNFRGSWQWTPWIAPVTYVLALPATLLIALGWLRPRIRIPLLFFAMNLALAIAAGVRYDAWSCFQSRLFFPSLAALALGYAWGIERVPRRIVDVACIALYVAFVAYFGIEFAYVIGRFL